ncbi:MAG: EAL domain-containing protein [Porticoccaceae bacterium]|nr:EAL domain-containing protein [Porticoccaceae bacterium]
MIDDDLVACEIARDLLESNGFVVSLANDGLQGLARFKSEQPDLILLDVEMPNMDGFEVCQHLRALPEGAHIPVIMITGRDDLEAVEEAFEVKATDFVTKPFSWAVLVQRIRYLLRAATTLTELARSEQRLLSAQKMASLGYWDWDIASDMLYLSAQACEVVGDSSQNFKTGSDFFNIIHEDDRHQFRAEIDTNRLETKPWLLECRIVTAADDVRTIKVSGESRRNEANQSSKWLMGTLLDITEQRRSEETIRRMAFYDDVTGLHNRIAFVDELELVLNLHKRMDATLAVLYMDLDEFKRVNDSLGHHVGDNLLKQFADRLNEDLRASDLLARGGGSAVLARLGGDEFTLFLSGLRDKADASLVAQRIHDNLEQPFLLRANSSDETFDSHEIYITTSIGIALYPDDGQNADELLKNADTAMYAAKRAGKNGHRFYINEMNERALERLEMEGRLRSAPDRQEFSLHYQPQLELATGKLVGVEALLRWKNAELGNVSPGDFIPLAEETGQIISIGSWVLEEACRQATEWLAQGLPSLRVAVNLSGIQFRHGRFEEEVAEVLKKTGLSPELLELELTESIIMGEVEQNIAALCKLKSMGVMISIDDFGTGYSSLSYLRRFPIDSLKIDQSFIRSLETDLNNVAITNAIIAMGHSLGFVVVAEGIETKQQLEFLKTQGCEIGQGYLFSKPVPAEQIPDLFKQLSDCSTSLPGLSRSD